jgi:hypothetical protein
MWERSNVLSSIAAIGYIFQTGRMDEPARHGEEDAPCAAFSPFDGRLNARIAAGSRPTEEPALFQLGARHHG